MAEHFGQFSLIGVNFLTVILAAIIFYVVASWYQVLAKWIALKYNSNRDNFNASLKLAKIWTIFVLIIFGVTLFIAAEPKLKYMSDWGGHNVMEDPFEDVPEI
ncbi:MAG: hypothetical protein Hyperionvirus4_152 [Hyperionvirus sp.]|uniref:Uncharacterized protein n=1 Tax=Hyperionvirus sp. TaxID=2487770 RepID=A0A3G5A7G8_9VIRU|nr:MAG: hypothetical protein Hyperionvirus4_152 [Hyperionvirus sp.]